MALTESFFARWERVIKNTPRRPRIKTPTMEQDDEVAAVAAVIYSAWMADERFTTYTPPYYLAELAARALKQSALGEVAP